MKKKIFALLLALVMTVAALAGCGKDEEFVSDVSIDDMSGSYTVETRGLDEALLHITYKEDTGEIYHEDTSAYIWFGDADQTIGEMMADWNMVSIEPMCEGFEFLGWQACQKVTVIDEEFGFEDTVENILFDGKIFTTEEMMSQEMIAGEIVFYTVWDLVCGECEEHKMCQVIYLDDDRYFVCDDCYEEFAIDNGLVE